MRTHWQIAGQANTTIRQARASGEAVAQGVLRIDKPAGLARRGSCGRVGQVDVRLGLVDTLLAADPLGGAAVVIVSIAEQAVAQRAERRAVLIPSQAQGRLRRVSGR